MGLGRNQSTLRDQQGAILEGGSGKRPRPDSVERWSLSGRAAGNPSLAEECVESPIRAERVEASKAGECHQRLGFRCGVIGYIEGRDRIPQLRMQPGLRHNRRGRLGACAQCVEHTAGILQYGRRRRRAHPSAAWTWPPLWAGVQALCKSVTPSSATPERDHSDTKRPKRQRIFAVEIQRLMKYRNDVGGLPRRNQTEPVVAHAAWRERIDLPGALKHRPRRGGPPQRDKQPCVPAEGEHVIRIEI